MSGGWGAGGWGLSPWGSGAENLRMVSAVAIRENLVRVSFSEPPKYTRDLDANDASDPRRFSIQVVPGTSGLDGAPTRPVRPCKVDVSREQLAGGASLDVWVDRHFSPHASQYVITANQLVSGAGLPLEPGFTSAPFYGLMALLGPNVPELAVPRSDFAQPDNLAALLDPIGSTSPDLLGDMPVDTAGDYASDDGITSFKKRCFRRLTTKKNSMLHLPGYGVGTLEQAKRIGLPEIRAQLRADAESQLREEPETIDCSVDLQTDPSRTVWFLRVRIKTAAFGYVSLSAPFSPTAP
jgi:hypothetical protein